MPGRKRSKSASRGAVRYAVVGIGYISQVAVLPAFRHARSSSKLVALVSGDARKRKELGRKYAVPTYGYDEYDALLAAGDVDAVYIALPNDLHREYVVRAARAGVHVLCEKPLGVDERDCRAMIEACRRHKVKLMTAYRLHFESATLSVLEAIGSGALGEAKLFDSTFTMEVKAPNIRLEAAQGGGTLYDIGVYCINMARHVFRAEPVEVFAATAGRAGGVEESASCMLRFPGDRLATFVTSFGAAKTSQYRIVGTRGSIQVEPGYELASGLTVHLTVGEKRRTMRYAKRDQFAPELIHFSECIRKRREPGPSGEEGLADVRVIRALYRSAQRNRPVRLEPKGARRTPTKRQEINRAPVARTAMVNATPPGG